MSDPRFAEYMPDNVIVEYAVEYAGGHMLLRPSDVERVYPLTQWLEHHSTDRVYYRTVIVVEDWIKVVQ